MCPDFYISAPTDTIEMNPIKVISILEISLHFDLINYMAVKFCECNLYCGDSTTLTKLPVSPDDQILLSSPV